MMFFMLFITGFVLVFMTSLIIMMLYIFSLFIFDYEASYIPEKVAPKKIEAPKVVVFNPVTYEAYSWRE